MSKGYGRWSKKSDQWSELTDALAARVSEEDFAELLTLLENANVRAKLTAGELNWLEEFICVFKTAATR